MSEDDARRAAARYGPAVAFAATMYRHLIASAQHPVEVEFSVDETDEVTTAADHVYLATEMKRLGMAWVSFAPRYIGAFEKGVEYIGDRDELYRSLVRHSAIAQAFGPYKLSLHSGSDKFGIYPLAAEATGRRIHLKTSGTSYLVAVGIAAQFDPSLFRSIYDASREAFRGSRASYHVSARVENTPDPDSVPDARIIDLVTNFDSRQILHVGYAAVLRDPDGSGPSLMSVALRDLLETHYDAYEAAMQRHFEAHLRPFSLEAP
jgi:hypothetical protein